MVHSRINRRIPRSTTTATTIRATAAGTITATAKATTPPSTARITSLSPMRTSDPVAAERVRLPAFVLIVDATSNSRWSAPIEVYLLAVVCSSVTIPKPCMSVANIRT